MLNLKQIKKDYVTSSETVNALKGVSISFRKTEFVSILGPSGCGKTTLLNIIGGLDHYTDGDMMIGTRSTKSYGDRDWDVYRNHRVGFIFQSYNLIPHQTVLGNVELALTIAGISREERIARSKEALDRVGLKDQYYKKPNQLSGGQCQRVAIARALVNNPEILLADEPTGALDTVTSVQIMELIKEISKERLVIMVTHNPELAEQYSTRIVKLLDGNILEDTNPMTDEEIAAEEREEFAQKEAETAELNELTPKEKKAKAKANKKRREKAKMSFFTAFMLSARNLWSKRGRTSMVGFAGSIGIIGIAMVLAFSAGITGYVESMQDDLLSGNPITITKTAYDFSALSGMINDDKNNEDKTDKQDGRVYISSIVEFLAKMQKTTSTIVTENTITEEYIDFLKCMPEESYNAMLFGYGHDLSMSIYTDFKYSPDSTARNISVSNLVDLCISVLEGTEFKDYSSFVTTLMPQFAQAPSNTEYIESQYEIVAGTAVAKEANEIMLVLDKNEELSDLLLAMLGYYSQTEFEEIVRKATSTDGSYDDGIYRDSFTYEELLGKELTWYPNDTIFSVSSESSLTGGEIYTAKYNNDSSMFADSADNGGVKLKIVGILEPGENVSYGCLTSGVYYTEALTDHILEQNMDSEIVNFINDDEKSAMLAYNLYKIEYDYEYTKYGEKQENNIPTTGSIGPQISAMSFMSGAASGGMSGSGGSSGGSSIDLSDVKESFIRALGGNSLPESIKIYPISFDEKYHVTDYLDKWNAKGDVVFGDTTISRDDRQDIDYTDTLDLVIAMINTMINIISYALIAFTSVSLVVSTVMIGIITYVSVVERIKEIGVIRSLGGRKKDVSALFIAETFIIGFLAGTLGIVITYIVSFIVNLILEPLIGFANIAALPLNQAVVLILLSIGLTLISGLIPARSAAKKDPVVALRTE